MDANNRRMRETGEAAQWWVRLGTRLPNEISRQDREQFSRWLRESPLHIAEMLHVARVHDALERFKGWQEVPIAAAEEKENTVISFERKTDMPMPARKPHRKLFAFAMTVTMAAIAASILLPQIRGDGISTEITERRAVMLEDGSRVHLEPETILRVKLAAHERHVVLDRGQALFHVAKDANRPFFVHVGNTVVRAVGTAFGIEHQGGAIKVTVSEGKVAVLTHPVREDTTTLTEKAKLSNKAEVFLTAGQQLIVSKIGAVEPVHKVDSTRELAWADGRLIFDATPLSEVVKTFNRYNHQQLRVEDPQLARRPVSGVFQATDPETLLAFIRAGANADIVRQDARQMLITPRSAE